MRDVTSYLSFPCSLTVITANSDPALPRINSLWKGGYLKRWFTQQTGPEIVIFKDVAALNSFVAQRPEKQSDEVAR